MKTISKAHKWIKTDSNAHTPLRFWAFTVYTDRDKAALPEQKRDELHPITAWYVAELFEKQGFKLEGTK